MIHTRIAWFTPAYLYALIGATFRMEIIALNQPAGRETACSAAYLLSRLRFIWSNCLSREAVVDTSAGLGISSE